MIDLDALSRAYGSRVAVRTPDAETGYDALIERALALRERLVAGGLLPGDRVALACARDVDTVATALALASHGCAIMPASSELTETEREDVCAAFGARWIGDGGPGAPPKSAPEEIPDLAQALLSSGSTGAPKIVLRSRGQVEAGVRIHGSTVGLHADDRVLALVPLSHSYGFNSVMQGALLEGASIVLPPSTHPRGVAQTVLATGVTLFPGPAIFFDMMNRFLQSAGPSLRSVRACIAVGDITSADTWQTFTRSFGVPLWQSYGASEAGPVLLNRDGAVDDEGRLALGTPYREVEALLWDDAGRPVPDGTVGEIVVRSPAVALGYQGEGDGASRVEDGLFFSGDLAVRRDDGVVCFAGRAKLLIATAGRKVDPMEVERVLLAHPAVVDAAVVPHREGDREIVRAVVVCQGKVAATELIDHCSASLSAYKVPRLVDFRDALPRNDAGKLQREAL
ncbi:MAG: class I adenylate-forming enzyme family protein [Myxococcota bacterium]